ncbi:hypothetical protein ACF3M1_12065 [Luteimonas sp. WGS1318]|uniref:hypothetical protein n=1 Tax=Luteimonas sp. WGS1318 TaxID=3366815 RepID=UPI00372D774C
MTGLPVDVERAFGALARMLPVWRSHLRAADAFWPQFDALSAQLLARVPDGPMRARVRARLDALLAAEGLTRPADAERGGRHDRPVQWVPPVAAAEVPAARDHRRQNR